MYSNDLEVEAMLVMLERTKLLHMNLYDNTGICHLILRASSEMIREARASEQMNTFVALDRAAHVVRDYISDELGGDQYYITDYLRENNLPHDKDTVFLCRQAWLDKLIENCNCYLNLLKHGVENVT